MRAIELYEYHATREVTPSPEIIEKINRDCKVALESTPIYRGIDAEDSILYGNPDSPRESANTENYYTVMMDELPSWKHLPKRSLSWICSTSLHISMEYGNAYRVLPVGNPNIAVASNTDIWFSFSRGLKALTPSIYNLNGFNDLLSRTFEEAVMEDIIITPDFKSLKGMAAIIDEFARQQDDGLDIGNDLKTDGIKDFLNDVISEKGFVNLMNEIVLNPGRNGITKQTLKSLDTGHYNGREIWFNGPAYFIENGKMEHYFQ